MTRIGLGKSYREKQIERTTSFNFRQEDSHYNNGLSGILPVFPMASRTNSGLSWNNHIISLINSTPRRYFTPSRFTYTLSNWPMWYLYKDFFLATLDVIQKRAIKLTWVSTFYLAHLILFVKFSLLKNRN